jgi:hypothetical protein
MDSAKVTWPVGGGRRLPCVGLYQRLVRPALFRTDPEWIHDRSVRAAEAISRSGWVRGRVDRRIRVDGTRLATTVSGLRLRSPLGLAAGYDMNARATPLLSSLGFGQVEVGRCRRTPRPAAPHLDCGVSPPADEVIVGYYRVPNEGADRVPGEARRPSARGAGRGQPL